MRRETLLIAVLACIATAGCSMANRLTFIRPSAERGEVTQVAPVYDVSGGKRGKSPTMAAGDLLAVAYTQYQMGKLPQAEEAAARALKLSPSSADANSIMAMILDGKGDASRAGGYYQKAVSLAPASGIHANNYGIWLCANGRAPESLSWFDTALADPAYPTRAAAMANAGSCAGKAGQVDRAESSWRQALALEPTNLAALSGMAGLQFARGRYLDARAFAERWLALAPADAQALQLASQIELKLGDTAASTRYLHRLQALPAGAANVPRVQ